MFGRSQSELKLRARRLVIALERPKKGNTWAPAAVCAAALLLSQIWLPTNPLASRHSTYSPWPNWTATVAYSFGVTLRDFEVFDAELEIDELMKAQDRMDSR